MKDPHWDCRCYRIVPGHLRTLPHPPGSGWETRRSPGLWWSHALVLRTPISQNYVLTYSRNARLPRAMYRLGRDELLYRGVRA